MKIVIAPNAFKNALSATEVADAIESGLAASGLVAQLIKFPVGDGGDGTGLLLAKHLRATWKKVEVSNPIGKPILSGFHLLENGETAIIEMADASGLRLLNKGELNPLLATSFGTGQLIGAALMNNVRKILLCVGGTATVDGGAGALLALGVKWIDSRGNQIINIPSGLSDVASLDMKHINNHLPHVEIVLLCDVSNPLIGKHGAARVFAPQKGATESDVRHLEVCLAKLAKVVSDYSHKTVDDVKYGGAAGGIGATLYGLLGARLCNGIDYLLDITGFETALRNADVVITGEGMIDEQTLGGKGPYGVALRAKTNKVRVIAVAGRISSADKLHAFFDEIICINPEGPGDVSASIAMTRNRLMECSRALGQRLAARSYGTA
jgi:glycerate 2-kinase